MDSSSSRPSQPLYTSPINVVLSSSSSSSSLSPASSVTDSSGSCGWWRSMSLIGRTTTHVDGRRRTRGRGAGRRTGAPGADDRRRGRIQPVSAACNRCGRKLNDRNSIAENASRHPTRRRGREREQHILHVGLVICPGRRTSARAITLGRRMPSNDLRACGIILPFRSTRTNVISIQEPKKKRYGRIRQSCSLVRCRGRLIDGEASARSPRELPDAAAPPTVDARLRTPEVLPFADRA
jgi:hypothetical protein